MTREDKIVDSVPMRKVNLCFHYTSKANWPQWKPAPWFREGHGTLLQHSCLENPTDGGAWWAAVHGVTVSQTWLSHFTFTFHFHALEKEMATHSSVLAWRIPGTAEPGGLPSMESHRVGHDWSDLAAAAAAIVSFLGILISWIFTEYITYVIDHIYPWSKTLWKGITATLQMT